MAENGCNCYVSWISFFTAQFVLLKLMSFSVNFGHQALSDLFKSSPFAIQ